MAPTPASYVSRLYRSGSIALADVITVDGRSINACIVDRLDTSTVRRIGGIVGVGKTVGMDGETVRRAVAATALLFIDLSGGEWINHEPRNTSTPVVPVAPVAPVVPTPTTEKEEPVTPTTPTTPTPADDALMEALIIIKDAMASSGSAVDEEKVRDIVADCLANRPADRLDVIVNGVITGAANGHRHEKFAEVAFCLANGMHVYLGGPAGTGKSFTAMQAAVSVGLSVRGVITGNPMLMESRVFGYMPAGGDFIDTSGLYEAYKSGGVFIVDEIDNASPNITVMLNTVMASDCYTFPNGETVSKHEDFRIVATANTFGTGPTAQFSGRFPLDPSTLDRFERIMMDYDKSTDRFIAERVVDTALADDVLAAAWAMRASMDSHGLRGFVTPRGIDRACKFYAGGFPWTRVVECLVPAGMNDGQRRQLLENVKNV